VIRGYLGLAVLPALLAAGTVAAASPPLSCSPHLGLGTLTLARGSAVREVDLADCRVRALHPRAARPGLVAPGGVATATVRVTGSKRTLRNTIWVTSRRGAAHAVYSAKVSGDVTGLESAGPIWLLGWSGDARWIFFAIDSGSSASIAADGLVLQVVAAAGGAPHRLGVTLPYSDYLAWCGGSVVYSAGRDRIAIHGKRLLIASPPAWRPRALVAAPGRSFGSLTCAPAGRSVVVQSQPSSTNAGFFATHWSLWSVALDGRHHVLTSPPKGFSDESPRLSADGRTLLFVRSRGGHGQLYALDGGRLEGPLLALGYELGYYGHRDWWQTMAWSRA